MLTGKEDTFFTYRATVVPKVWLLGLNQNFRIFQNVTVEEIVTKIFNERQIPSDEFVFKLKSDYQRDATAPSTEKATSASSAAFWRRKAIFYFFEQTEDSHTIVFSDY